MKQLRVRPEAEIDAFEAALWYEVLGHIQELPLRFPIVSNGVRRAMLRRFPFAVFFVVDDDRSTVIAVMHLHRDPTSWGQRR
jgi:hypothetical protein